LSNPFCWIFRRPSGTARRHMQEDRISRGIVLKSCHFHNLLFVPQKTQPINVFFILKSCHYRFLPHSYQFVSVSSLSKHSTTCDLNYWQRRQRNNSYKLQEARQTCRCVQLMKVHDDISHGVVRCAWVSYCRPHVNSSDQWPLSAGARYVYLVRSVQTGRGADPASYSVGTWGSFAGDILAGAESLLLPSI